jgi:uncharacterized membrane protein YhaH (DUF805 family)
MFNLFLHLIDSKESIMILMLNYILFAVAFCKLAQKAKVKNEWLAFIPFLQFVIFLHIIDRSGWYMLLLIVPLVNIILIEVWFVEFYNSFNISLLWIVLSLIIYPINCGYIIYMSYCPDVKYIGNNSF